MTWGLNIADRSISRRAGALAAIAASLSPRAVDRLEGALFEAGLAAQRGLNIWLRRKGSGQKDLTFIETLPSLREAIFKWDGPKNQEPNEMLALFSPVRVFGDVSMTLEGTSSKPVIRWQAGDDKRNSFKLGAPDAVQVIKLGELIQKCQANVFAGLTLFNTEAKTAGTQQVWLSFGSSFNLPVAGHLPRFEEVTR